MPPKAIGLIAHTGKLGAADLVRAIRDEFRNREVTVTMEALTGQLLDEDSPFKVEELARVTDLLVVLGGDGTILNVVSQIDGEMCPILGINIGSLGFLTCVTASGLTRAVESVLSDEVIFSNRSLLKIEIIRDGQAISRRLALNDAVVSRGELSRLIRLEARVNGEMLTEFNADGVIVATPTGSTAYSLSAGGPILEPESGVFVITPICPHVLTNRSVIVAERAVIEIQACKPEPAVYLTADGGEPTLIEFGSVIRIAKAPTVLPLAVLPEASFFNIVRQKLRWTGSNI